MVDKKKVIWELRERMADPFQKEICEHLEDRINQESPLGKLFIDMLRMAENGEFKEGDN